MAFNNYKYFISSVVMALACNSGFAATWQETNNKGLLTYTIGNASTGQLKLVCDPENLWAGEGEKQSRQFYMIAAIHNQNVESDTVSIKAQDYSASLANQGGAIVVSNDKDNWNKLILAVSAKGDVTVSAGAAQFSIIVDEPLNSRCAIPTE